MEVVSTNVINFNKFRTHTEWWLQLLEEQTRKQLKIEQFMVEEKKMRSELYDHVNDKLGSFSERVVQFSKDLEEKQIQFEGLVKENEKKTVWKIQDCEKLLQSRVSDKYVNDAVKAVRDKFEMDMKFWEEREMERLFKSFRELEKRIETTNDFLNDSFNSFWSQVTKLEDDMKEKLSTADLGPVAASVKECKYNYEWEVELI